VSGATLPVDRANELAEQLVYERVIACIDFDQLFRLEQELWFALGAINDDDREVAALSKELIDKALRLMPDDPRRYAAIQPFGAECELCEQEAHAQPKARTDRRT
jgi:hypothetical protein